MLQKKCILHTVGYCLNFLYKKKNSNDNARIKMERRRIYNTYGFTVMPFKVRVPADPSGKLI